MIGPLTAEVAVTPIQALALGPVHLSALTRLAGLGVQVHWTILEKGRFGWTLDCTGSGSRDQCT